MGHPKDCRRHVEHAREVQDVHWHTIPMYYGLCGNSKDNAYAFLVGSRGWNLGFSTDDFCHGTLDTYRGPLHPGVLLYGSAGPCQEGDSQYVCTVPRLQKRTNRYEAVDNHQICGNIPRGFSQHSQLRLWARAPQYSRECVPTCLHQGILFILFPAEKKLTGETSRPKVS